MDTTPHFGIRCESDLTHRYSEYIVGSVDTINEQLSINNFGFFFDTVDVCRQVIGGKHCWDMFGWIVPNRLTLDFERSWLADDDAALEEYNAYVCVSWEDHNGIPHAVIDGNLPEEAYG